MLNKKLISLNEASPKHIRILSRLYADSPVISVTDDDRVVIFSDLHMGDGSSTDDFNDNRDLFNTVLQKYYLRPGKEYISIFNGDTEERIRFNPDKIRLANTQTYRLFDQFKAMGKFFQNRGNHDDKAVSVNNTPVNPSLVLDYKGNRFFIFHGHQTDLPILRNNLFEKIAYKYFANTLGIMNFTIAHRSTKTFWTEKNAYEFSRRTGIVSIVGHTHRALFESESARISLRIKIENLCNVYPTAKEEDKSKIKQTIAKYKKELETLDEKNSIMPDFTYSKDYMLPLLFNSGHCIGSDGITAIEIKHGNISLVHWGKGKPEASLYNEHKKSKRFGDFTRTVYRRDTLTNVFTKIELLK